MVSYFTLLSSVKMQINVFERYLPARGAVYDTTNGGSNFYSNLDNIRNVCDKKETKKSRH